LALLGAIVSVSSGLLGAILAHLGDILGHLWSIFGAILAHFGLFWEPFWANLELSWAIWTILGHLEAFLRTKVFFESSGRLACEEAPKFGPVLGSNVGDLLGQLGPCRATSSTSSGSKTAQEEP
jgi:hypothetical protein